MVSHEHELERNGRYMACAVLNCHYYFLAEDEATKEKDAEEA